MAALVVPGAPVSALIEHGLTEEVAGVLAAGGVGTVELLGEMTPEQLEAVPGITPEMVEGIRQAVVGYYGQFEGSIESTNSEPAAGGAESEEQSVTIEKHDSSTE